MIRPFLAASAMALSLLAGCNTISSSTTGSVTTVTVDLVKLDADVQAAVAAAQVVMISAAAIPQVAAVAPAVNAALLVMQADSQALSAGGKAVVTFDKSAPPAAIQSLLDDSQKVLDQLNGVVLPPDRASKISPYIAQIRAAMAAIKAAVLAVRS